MLHIEVTGDKREGEERFKVLDMADYAKKTFGMFGGEEQTVKLFCENTIVGAIIDRFGKDIFMTRVDEAHFAVNVNVVVSRQFLAWVFGLGEKVKIVGPESVVQQMKDEAGRLMRQYNDL